MAVLAEASGLHSRRISVLISALEDLEVIERSGRSLTPIGKLGSDQLEDLFGDFDAQHRAECARLEAIIHYCESPDCRMQLLRDYFGEARGDNCNRCDNCQNPPVVT